MQKKRLPPEDRVRVRRVKRSKFQIKAARLLELMVRHWDLLSHEEQEVARYHAKTVGEFHAEHYPRKRECWRSDYVATVVDDAWRRKVMNDVEYELWKSWRQDDPRIVSFQLGFRDFRKARAAKKNGSKKRKK